MFFFSGVIEFGSIDLSYCEISSSWESLILYVGMQCFSRKVAMGHLLLLGCRSRCRDSSIHVVVFCIRDSNWFLLLLPYLSSFVVRSWNLDFEIPLAFTCLHLKYPITMNHIKIPYHRPFPSDLSSVKFACG